MPVRSRLDTPLDLVARDLHYGEYQRIRDLWLVHTSAEERYFESGAQSDLNAVLATFDRGCEIVVHPTSERWEGLEGATLYYQLLRRAFRRQRWVLEDVAIGSQGVIAVATLEATQEVPFGGLDSLGSSCSQWIVCWPWIPEVELFGGERIYALLPKRR